MASEEIHFRLNGEDATVVADPATPLMFILRNDLGLKGTRLGCGQGECGSCTVLIDGKAHTSCSLHISAIRGRHIETVESLAGDGSAPHPLYASVLAEQAGQCGYCLAGILMRAKGLLDHNPSPSRAEIVAALDGHICRCGAHARLIRAVARAAAIERGEVA